MNSIFFNDQSMAIFTGNLFPSTASSSGADLVSQEDVILSPMEVKAISTGIFLHSAIGVDIQVRGRSGLALKGVFCHLGTIDVDYRDEIKAIIQNLSYETKKISYGDRIAQIVVCPKPALWHNRPNTIRDGGFGSTGGFSVEQ